MAAINPKEYDPSKNIARTVFRGAPNLFTSADINRQIQALQAQLDALEQKVGVKLTGFDDIWASLNTSAKTFVVKAAAYEDDGEYEHMKVYARGCIFDLGTDTLTSSAISYSSTSFGTWYVFIKVGTPTLLPYLSDPTHETTGAKFTDGTIAEAADQLVYQATPSLVVRNSMRSAEDDEILIAQVTIDREENNSTIKLSEAYSTAILECRNVLKSYDKKKVVSNLELGVGYESILSHVYRSLVPIGSILPFYGSIEDLGDNFGWVPCIPIAKGAYNASISDFANDDLYKIFKALYGSSITFEVINGAGFSYLRISACRGKSIPNLFGKFLTGASVFAESSVPEQTHYTIGATGGENKHTLSSSESGVPAHMHPTDEKGEHRHEVTYWQNGDGSADTEKHSTGWNVDGKTSQNDGVYPLGGSSTGGTNPDNCIILSAGYGSAWIGRDYLQFKTAGKHSHTAQNNTAANASSAHENRPPYHAVYYIMRVC